MKHIIVLLVWLALQVPHAYSASIVTNAFNKGELSPFLRGRTDVRAYYSGCETLENMLVMPYGGVRKRPGTYYIAAAKNADRVCRLMPFEYSVADNYVIEAGHLYMRFFRDGGQIIDYDGSENLSAVGSIVAHWKLNDDAASTAVVDADGATHDGVASANTDVFNDTGVTNGALDMDGQYYATVTDDDDFTFDDAADDAFSIAAWVYYVPNASWQYILSKEDYTSGSEAREWSLVVTSSDQIYFYIHDETNNSYESVRSGIGFLSGGWHYIVGTYDGRGGVDASYGMTLYVEGEALTRYRTVSGTYAQMRNTGAAVIIGGYENTSGSITDFWADKLDNIAVFDKEITQAEIDDLFDTTVDAYEITTTYTEEELNSLQYIQSADEMYIVHPDHAPAKLTRAGHVSWTLADVSFTEGPFKPENLTTTTLNPSAATGSITIEASATGTFKASHVNSHWQISHYISAVEIAGQVTDNHDSSSLTVYKGQSYDYNTYNTWVGKTTLQRSYDAGSTWFDVIPFTSSTAENTTYAGEEELADAVYRVHYVDTSGTMEYSVIAHSFKREGIAKITAYTDSDTVTATVTKTLGATSATTYWSEAAWSDDEGYPSCIAFVEERQAYANTTGSPQTLWFSETDDWNSFLEGAESSDAISRTIAANQVNAIQWLSPQTMLMFGTTGGEWKLYASGADEPLAPDNVNVKRQAGYGSTNIQAQVMNNSTIFVQRNGEIVRKLQYSFDVDMWIAPDLTVLAEHITGDGITQIALQKTPYPVLWCVREDGELLGLTMEESQEVLGWHHHDFGGDVESVAVIPGISEDEVWIAIERVIDSSTARYIEQLQPIDWGADQEDMFFVDSGLTYDGGAAVTISDISSASPAVVTAANHGFSDGDQIRISGLGAPVHADDVPVILGFDQDGDDVIGASDVLDIATEYNAGRITLYQYYIGLYFYTSADPIVATLATLEDVFLHEIDEKVFSVGTVVDVDSFQLRDASDAVNIDSTGYSSYSAYTPGTATRVENTFTVTHLTGETLSVIGDGGYYGTVAVSSDTITLDNYYNTVHAGIPFTAKVKPMTLSMASEPGSLFGVNQRITEVLLRLHETLDCEVGADFTTMDPYTFRDVTDLLEAATPVYTGDKILSFPGSFERQGNICIQSAKPLPLTVLGLRAEFEAER